MGAAGSGGAGARGQGALRVAFVPGLLRPPLESPPSLTPRRPPPPPPRFLRSAAKASIPLPRGLSRAQLRRTILETAAASCETAGFVRYFLSAGRGGFGLSGHECLRPALYVMVYTKGEEEEARGRGAHLSGWKVKTSPVPAKAPYFAGVKSNNYLPNALALMDAEAGGFHQGIFLDAEGRVAEGPNMNLACLGPDGTLVVPPFESALAGVTIQRVMDLLPQVGGGGGVGGAGGGGGVWRDSRLRG